MISLNAFNGAQTVLSYYQMRLLSKFENGLIGVELGIAYGGGVELLGAMWKGRGDVYGYDTFEALHPDQLATEKFGFQARCMDHWYDPEVFGTEALSFDFQRKQLDIERLTNVHLVKGLITEDSCKDLPYIHYALLDMDIEASMRTGWDAIKNKLIPGSIVFFHDVVPKTHIPAVSKFFYDEVLKDETLELIGEWPMEFLAGVVKLSEPKNG